MTESEKIVFPADVYDALELSVRVHKGVGATYVIDKNGAPLCLYGHSEFITDGNSVFGNEVAVILDRVLPKRYHTNNDAVYAINQRLGKEPDARVSWEAFTEEASIVRGD